MPRFPRVNLSMECQSKSKVQTRIVMNKTIFEFNWVNFYQQRIFSIEFAGAAVSEPESLKKLCGFDDIAVSSFLYFWNKNNSMFRNNSLHTPLLYLSIYPWSKILNLPRYPWYTFARTILRNSLQHLADTEDFSRNMIAFFVTNILFYLTISGPRFLRYRKDRGEGG